MASQLKIGITAQDEGFSAAMNNATKAASKTADVIDKVKTGSLNARQAYSQLNKATQQLTLAYNAMSKEMQQSDIGKQLAAQLAEAKQQTADMYDFMGDFRQEIANMASDTAAIDQVVGVFQGLNAVVQVGTGIMAEFGASEEETQQIQQKLMALINIGNGLQTIQNLLQKQSVLWQLKKNIATKAATVAEVYNNSVTKGGTVIQTAWNVAKAVAKALLGDFSGLLLVGATAFTVYEASTIGSTEATEDETDAKTKQKKAHEAMIELIDSENDSLADNVAKYHQSATELNGYIALVQNFKGTATQQKKLLDEINDKYGAQIGYVHSLAEAQRALTQVGKIYIAYLNAQSRAQALTQYDADLYVKKFKGEITDDFYNQEHNRVTSQLQSELKDVVTLGAAMDSKTKELGLSTTKSITKHASTVKKTAKKTTSDYIKSISDQLSKAKFGSNVYNNLTAKLLGKTGNTSQYFKIIGDDLEKRLSEPNLTAGLRNNIRAALVENIKKELTLMLSNLDISNADEFVSKISKLFDLGAGQGISNALNEGYRKAQNIINAKDQQKADFEAGVDKSEVTKIQHQIDKIQAQLDNNVDENGVELPLTLRWNKEEQIRQLRQAKRDILGNADSSIVINATKPRDKTFDYKKSRRDIISEQLEDLQKQAEYLKPIADNDEILYTSETMNEAKTNLADITNQIVELKKEAKLEEIKDDIKEYADNLKDIKFETIRTGISDFQELGDMVLNFGDSIDKCKNAWEAFWLVFNDILKVFDMVNNIISLINNWQNAVTLLTGAQATLNAVEAADAGAKAVETGQEIAANKMLTATYSELAASKYMAAHAAIPFLGYGLGAGFVAKALATIKAAGVVGVFANGGIVEGPFSNGDRMLARVNGGEMILNNRQQSHLFNLLDSGIDKPLSNSGRVDFKLSGSNLYGCLKNYGKSKSLTGKNIGIK